MEAIREIVTSYYLWLAVEAAIIVVLFVFVKKYTILKRSRIAEIKNRIESDMYSQLDAQIMSRIGRN